MISPLASAPEHLSAFSRLEAQSVRRACTSLVTAFNQYRPQSPDDKIIQFECGGVVITQTVFKGWRGRSTNVTVAATMWTGEWQIVWDNDGVWMGGDAAAFDRDIIYLMMTIDGRDTPELTDLDLRDLQVVGVSQEGPNRLLPIG